jgi:hypothetical protein
MAKKKPRPKTTRVNGKKPAPKVRHQKKVSPAERLLALAQGTLADEIIARRGELDRQKKRARTVLQRHESKLLKQKGVSGVDVGLKLTNDRYVRPARYVIRIHVVAKLGGSQLSSRARLPREIDGIEVDVLERRYVSGTEDSDTNGEPEFRFYRDPLSGGVAISGDRGATFGTLGMRVFKDGNPMYLTNLHVVPEVGAEVWQPPTKGPNTPVGDNRVVGTASEHQQRDDSVDCALITPSGSRGFEGLVLGIPANATFKAGSLRSRDENVTEVFKMGAKTGHDPQLLGIVDSVSASLQVEDMSFTGQIVVRGTEPGSFGDRGDSGAILLRRSSDDANSFEIVGLVHGTTADNRVAYASHFKKVQKALGFTLTRDGS